MRVHINTRSRRREFHPALYWKSSTCTLSLLFFSLDPLTGTVAMADRPKGYGMTAELADKVDTDIKFLLSFMLVVIIMYKTM